MGVRAARGLRRQEDRPPARPGADGPAAHGGDGGTAGARVAAEDTLHWDALIGNRRVTLDKCDSIIGTLLAGRAPEVTWVGPTELRRAARRAVGVAADPDQMGTAF